MEQRKFGFGNSARSLENSPAPVSTYLDFIQSRRGVRKPAADQESSLFDTADEKMMRIQDIIWQVADTPVPILVTGEEGSGKDMIAQSLKKAATDKSRAFLSLDCHSLAESMIEGEIFGVTKDAFPGAAEAHTGALEKARGGTLVINEVAKLSLETQEKILRVLQEKVYRPVGGQSDIEIDVRIIAMTSKDIVELVSKGLFRQDLYYRLYVIHLEIPPLRERRKDVDFLAHKFLREYSVSLGKPQARFSDGAVSKLVAHSWPGNVRELQNIVQRALVMSDDGIVNPDHLPLTKQPDETSLEWIKALPIGSTLRKVETHFILETLKSHKGNRTHAAKTLGISLRTLRNKINEFTAEGYEVIGPQNGRSAA